MLREVGLVGKLVAKYPGMQDGKSPGTVTLTKEEVTLMKHEMDTLEK
jgi:hypothetical protein